MRFFYLLFLLGVALMQPGSLYAREYKGWTVTNFNNENGLPQNSVKFAEIDKDGYLWLATQGGLVRYDGQRFRVFDNTNSSLLRNRYLVMGKDGNGNIFCTDDYLNTAFYNTRTGFSKPVVARNIFPASDGSLFDLNKVDLGGLAPLAKKRAHALYPESITYMYHPVGKGKGFVVLDNIIAGYASGGRVHRVDSLDCNSFLYRPVGSIGDKLCYIDESNGIVLMDTNGVRTRKKIPFAFPRWDKSQIGTVISLFNQEHQLLLNLAGNIYELKLDGDELTFHHLIDVSDVPFIISLRYYPEQDMLLVGSNMRGLFLFKKQQLVSIGENHSNADAFYALAPYREDRVLAVTGTLPNSPTVPGLWDALNRFSILRDHNRHYWYSNWFTLLETDEQFGVLKKIPLSEQLVCLREDEQGRIWLSQGKNNFGWVQDHTFKPYKLEDMEGKRIQSFIPAGDQTFWLVGKGLCLWIDVKNHRQRMYHEFDDVEIRTVYQDKQGSLWLGTYAQGYFLYRNGRFTKMPEDEAQYLKVVNCFLEDRHGFIWMTTNNGLFQSAVNDLYNYAEGKTNKVYHHYYGKESGLKASEFNGGCNPSGLQLANGLFVFPSMNGVVQFHPDSIRAALPTGKLFMEQILLDGMPIQRAALSRLPPSFKRLELAVSSPYFGNPRNLNIEYNIDGLDDRWYSLGENNRIVLNRLKYGNYKIRLRKEAGFGSDNYITEQLSLVVLPFFYQTWWFRIACGIFLVLLIVLIVKVRYRYLILRQHRLESEVKERTSALVYHNKLMEKLAVMIAHDLKSPLHFLSKVTGYLQNKIQQEDLPGIDRTSAEIKNTADQVYQFVEGFNLWASSFTEGFAINKTSFALDDLLQELRLFFNEMLEANGNRLLVTTTADYLIYTDRELLRVILRNIIDNANKHTQTCDISISVRALSARYISITVADTGGGMAGPVLKRIQDRIEQASTAAGIERNSRLGYQMIIDFTRRLDARLDVQSEPGKGTGVTILHLEGKINRTSLSSDLTEQVVGAG